ncbi:hypothetical protein ACET3Z_000422 [Daucus carota]
MVGLADIPIVGKLVDRISDAAVETIFRGFRYMFFYKNLVKTLDSQVEKANTEEERVSRKVAAERANGKLIDTHVDDWQEDAKVIKESAEKFAEKYKNRQSWRCIQCLPIPNPVSRFRLGREAVQKTKELTELINSGKELLANEIAHLAPIENLPKSNTEFQDFQSRKDSYGELWRALTTDSSPIVGIYGMPGVGKTRMMEQIWKEAKEKNIFNKVARANVGNEKLDVIQLQTQIAGYLDCNFVSEDNAQSRASQLKQSLLNATKTLVILDDVWSEIPLDFIGIPIGDGNSSKILLTSREENVCRHNNCKTLVKITPLHPDEAWDQFKKIVGTAQIDSMHDRALARKVCDKCGGLPLLIHAIGKALQIQTHNTWVDAFEQLEKGEFVNIPGVEPQVYACVELSIDKLHIDAKSCLFLCCLFPEDYDIPVKKVIQLATGSQLVSGESRVLSMVDTLISSSLLLDCEKDDSIKLHDIIRDVGRSIAFRDPNFAFSQVTCDVRLLHDAKFVKTKFLRLDLDGDNIHIPDDLVCPDLHSLWIQINNDIQQFSDGIFNMSANLRFLYLVDRYPYLKVQFSLQPLSKLRTLIFDSCDLFHINNTNGGFFPEYLETLCILRSILPQPLDLSNLKYLRKLEIKGGTQLRMMPNSISSLSGLEQLHIPGGIEVWSKNGYAVAKSIFVEINTLTHLKSLQMKFYTSEHFEDAKILDNLKLFNISARRSWLDEQEADLSYKTSIELDGYYKESLKSLVEKAEYVKLAHSNLNVNGIGSIFVNNQELRKLHIEECNKLEHLARMSQCEIQLSQQTSFSKLTYLEIERCSGLRYLFCNSVAKCLTQLQKLMIRDCPVMEAIVMNDGSSNGDIISFSQLKELELSKVPRLRSFYRENKDAIMQPSAQFGPLFHRMTFTLHRLESIKLEDLPNLKSFSRDQSYAFNMPALLYMEVNNCGFSTLFTCSVFRNLLKLRGLEVSNCRLLEVIVEDARNDDTNDKTITLPELQRIELEHLPNLKSFSRDKSIAFNMPALWKMVVDNCGFSTLFTCSTITLPRLESIALKDLPNLKSFSHDESNAFNMPALLTMEVNNCGFSTLFTCSVFRNLLKLEELKVSNCSLLEVIVESARGDETSGINDKTITLPRLGSIKLEHLPNLKSYSRDESIAFHMPALLTMAVDNCGFSTLFTCSVFRNLLKLRDLEVSNCRLLEIVISLPKLETLQLRNMPDLKSFIHGENYNCYMPALEKIRVDNCGFTTLFTCSVFRNLQILRGLRISNCRMLEVIVEDARGDETSGTNDKTITLPRLKRIQLEHLPNLISFSRDESYVFNMPALRKIKVDNCGFSTLFTCSVFRTLQQLGELKVSNCSLLEVVVEEARGEGRVSTDGDERKQVPDLNDYIKTLFEEEDVAVPEMKRIVG